MNLVIEWANDLPFKTWFELLLSTHLHYEDTAPDYQITLVNGKPYLYDPLLGGKWNWNASEKGKSLSWSSLSWSISERSSLDDMD